MLKLISLIMLIGIGAWGYQRYSLITLWYIKFFKISFIAQRFYKTYPHIFRDIVFNPNFTPRLDVYRPAHGTNHPVIIFIHGGGWYRYSKATFASVAMKLIPKDLVVVVPDYTLHPAGDYERMAQEVAAVVDWALDNVGQYGGDPQRVVISGHSAGAHLAMLAITDTRFFAQYGRSCQDIRGVIGMSGVYDIAAQDQFGLEKGVSTEIMRAVMRGPAHFKQSSPITHVRQGLPPILLIHGDQDAIVPLHISQAFQQAVQRVGGQCQLNIYEGAGHTDFLFQAFAQDESPTVTDMATFTYEATRRKNKV